MVTDPPKSTDQRVRARITDLVADEGARIYGSFVRLIGFLPRDVVRIAVTPNFGSNAATSQGINLSSSRDFQRGALPSALRDTLAHENVPRLAGHHDRGERCEPRTRSRSPPRTASSPSARVDQRARRPWTQHPLDAEFVDGPTAAQLPQTRFPRYRASSAAESVTGPPFCGDQSLSSTR
jgi:hypothetical protein